MDDLCEQSLRGHRFKLITVKTCLYFLPLLFLGCSLVRSPWVVRLGDDAHEISHPIRSRIISKAEDICKKRGFEVDSTQSDTTKFFVKRLQGAGGFWEEQVTHTYWITCEH